MSEDVEEPAEQTAAVILLSKRRKPKTIGEQVTEAVDSAMAKHFREQNEMMRAANADLSSQVRRLMTGIDRLLGETEGVRTGEKDEAFARVGPSDAPIDLPTVSADQALHYPHTASEIRDQLDNVLNASQIGSLLSKRGLGWAGDGAYQELSRYKKASQTKFWHRDVPARLRKILDDNTPAAHGIVDKTVLSIFRKWSEHRAAAALLEQVPTDGTGH